MIKRAISNLARRIAPSTMQSLEMMRVMREDVGDLNEFHRELRELRAETRELLAETKQTRRDGLRIAELTDIVVETLGKIERAASFNDVESTKP